MEYNINQLSYYAEDILQQFQNLPQAASCASYDKLKTATVHSVYRRTVNLTDGKNILSLQAAQSPLSPISLITALSADGIRSLDIKPGDTVSFDKDGFSIQGFTCSHRFSTTNARRYDLELSESLNIQSCSDLSSRISNALSSAETGGFAFLFCDEKANTKDLSLILRAAQNYILQSGELCIRHEYPKAAAELSRLLGLGIGLTPSGDDFLCGVLAGLKLSGNSNHVFTQNLKKIIAGRLSDTIDISAAFLACALKDQYSLQVNTLCRFPTAEALLTSFKEIGHSSGTDTLCGILWSLRHIPAN